MALCSVVWLRLWIRLVCGFVLSSKAVSNIKWILVPNSLAVYEMKRANVLGVHRDVKALSDGTARLMEALQHIPTFTSAIEEVIYNAFNSQATTIHVGFNCEVMSFFVQDNGCGIHPRTFASICEEPVSTLHTSRGFEGRGLSLKFLSELCVLQIFSRIDECKDIYKKVVNFGFVAACGILGRDGGIGIIEGTRIVVQDLFKMLPVRRSLNAATAGKRQRTGGYLRELCTRLSLMRSDVSILVVDEEVQAKIFNCSPISSMMQRFCGLLPSDDLSSAYTQVVHYAFNEMQIDGMLVFPSLHDDGCTVGNSLAEFQYFFVNGRWFKCVQGLDKQVSKMCVDLLRLHLHGKDQRRSRLTDLKPAFALNFQLPSELYDIMQDGSNHSLNFVDIEQCRAALSACVEEAYSSYQEMIILSREGCALQANDPIPLAGFIDPIESGSDLASSIDSSMPLSTNETWHTTRCLQCSQHHDVHQKPRTTIGSSDNESTLHSMEPTNRGLHGDQNNNIISGMELDSSQAPLPIICPATSTPYKEKTLRHPFAARFFSAEMVKDPLKHHVMSRSPELKATDDTYANGLPAANGITNIAELTKNSLFAARLKRQLFVPKWRDVTVKSGVVSRYVVEKHDIVSSMATLMRVRTDSSSKQVECKVTKDVIQQMKVICQVDRKFILTVHGGQLFCIDQHAADERVKLEALEKRYFGEEGNQLSLQTIEYSDPIRLDLTCQQMSTLGIFSNFTASWRFVYDLLDKKDDGGSGQATIFLKECPGLEGRYLDEVDFVEFLKYLHDQEALQPSTRLRPPAITRILHSKACRSAIMFGDLLSQQECEKLLEDLKKCALPFQCAHGRPSIVPIAQWTNEPQPQ